MQIICYVLLALHLLYNNKATKCYTAIHYYCYYHPVLDLMVLYHSRNAAPQQTQEIDPMLVQWTNIEPEEGQFLVFAEILCIFIIVLNLQCLHSGILCIDHSVDTPFHFWHFDTRNKYLLQTEISYNGVSLNNNVLGTRVANNTLIIYNRKQRWTLSKFNLFS